MTEVPKNTPRQVPGWRRSAIAAFTTFALLSGGVGLGVTQANAAWAEPNEPSADGIQASEPMTPKKVNPSAATNKYPKATNPQGSPAVIASEVTGPVDADVIADGRMDNYLAFGYTTSKGALGTYSGRLYLSDTDSFDTTIGTATALDDKILYMQWMDNDSPASPVFMTKSHDLGGGMHGVFGFADLNWVDENSTLHVFEPMSLVNNVRIKVWIAPGQKGPDGGELESFRQSPGMMHGFRNPGRDGYFGTFVTEQLSVTRGAVFVYEKPEGANPASYMTAPRDQWKIDTEGAVDTPSNTSGLGGNGNYYVSGEVWWETGEPDLSVSFPTNSNGEPKAPGMRVVLTSLTSEGTAAFAPTKSLKTAERIAEQKKLLKAHPEYIAQTVVAEVNEKGKYTARFDQKFDRASLYGFVIDKNDKIVTGYSPWDIPTFGDPNDYAHTAAFWQPARDSYYNVHFGLVPDPNIADITLSHDTGKNTAAIGDVVTPTVNTIFYDGQTRSIQWVDEQGNNVGEACQIPKREDVAKCTFTVPENAKPGSTYQARLIINGIIMDSAAFRVKDNMADDITPTWDNSTVEPGKTVEIPNDGDSLPANSKVKAEADQVGWTVSSTDDGTLSVTAPADAKPGDKTTVTVTVTYPDGSTDVEKVTVTVKDPNAGGTTADDITPTWNNSEVAPGASVEIPNTGEAIPADSTVAAETAAEGWTVEAANDGKLTVTAPAGAAHGDKATVKVTVTYPDGSIDVEHVTVTVKDPNAGQDDPANKDASKYQPNWDNQEVAPGKSVTADNNGDKPLPEGTTVEAVSSEADWTVAVNRDSITVTTPDTAKMGDKSTITATVTYPDGSTDTETFTVTVNDPTAKPTNADETTPNWDNSTVEPKATVEVPNNGDALPEGSKVEPKADKEGWTVEVVGDKGDTIKVTPPADAVDGDKTEVTVTVTYPDGSTGDETFTVTVSEKPNWDDANGTPGETVTIPNKGGLVPEGTTTEVAGPGTASIDENGNVVVKINEGANPGDTIEVTVKDKNGKEIDKITVTVTEPAGELPNWDDTAKGKPGDTVTVPNNGGTVPEGATVEIGAPNTATIDENGNVVVNIDGNAKDGDTITATIKDKDGNPIDGITITVYEDPKWDDGKGNPGGTVVVPNAGGDVPGGATVETTGPGKATIDDKGNINVEIDKDAKPGDTVTVTVKDKDGKVIDTTTITVVEKPKWDDGKGNPGGTVVVPNAGGDVPGGATVETTGPGKATIDDKGNISVEIDKDAKPGDTVTVTVKDKDGKVIDTTTITVTKPGNGSGSGDGAGTSTGKYGILARTGATGVLGALGLSGLLAAAGSLLARRRNSEE